MPEVPKLSELQGIAQMYREWPLEGFLPDSPSEGFHADMSHVDFNEYAAGEFQEIQVAGLSAEESRIRRSLLAGNIRAYWGEKLRSYIESCEKGSRVDDKLQVAFRYSTVSYLGMEMSARHYSRSTLTMEDHGEDQVSTRLVVDNPQDAPLYDFALRTRVQPQAPDYVTTEYEINMKFGWGAQGTEDLSVTKVQYNDLSDAPGYWDKVREEMGLRRQDILDSGESIATAIQEVSSVEGAPTKEATDTNEREQNQYEVRFTLKDSGDEILPIAELTNRYGLSRVNILRLQRQGVLRGVRIGDLWYISPDDIQKHLSEQDK